MIRKKTKRCVHISGILAEILKQHRTTAGRELTEVLEQWDETVGAAIAENAQPVGYRKCVLLVNVTSSVWIQQLQFLKADILSRLNDTLGNVRVDDVKFKIGPLIT